MGVESVTVLLSQMGLVLGVTFRDFPKFEVEMVTKDGNGFVASAEQETLWAFNEKGERIELETITDKNNEYIQ
jgi:hypothetical protein